MAGPVFSGRSQCGKEGMSKLGGLHPVPPPESSSAGSAMTTSPGPIFYAKTTVPALRRPRSVRASWFLQVDLSEGLICIDGLELKNPPGRAWRSEKLLTAKRRMAAREAMELISERAMMSDGWGEGCEIWRKMGGVHATWQVIGGICLC